MVPIALVELQFPILWRRQQQQQELEFLDGFLSPLLQYKIVSFGRRKLLLKLHKTLVQKEAQLAKGF